MVSSMLRPSGNICTERISSMVPYSADPSLTCGCDGDWVPEGLCGCMTMPNCGSGLARHRRIMSRYLQARVLGAGVHRDVGGVTRAD